MDLPYAEDVSYWRTSRSGTEVWFSRISRQLEGAGGMVVAEAFGSEAGTGRAAYMIRFDLGGDQFKIVWPVLPSKTGDKRAAQVQAITMIYHDIKARIVSAAVLGARASFFNYLLLPDGRTTTQVSLPELIQGIPKFLALPMGSEGER